jgi:hypothetical protein
MSDDGTLTDQLRVQRAVTDAQVLSGLAFTVVFCLGGADLEAQAEREFEHLGLVERPQVLVMVEPVAGQFVVAVEGRGRARLTDDACAGASAAMEACFAETNDVAACVELGLQQLCAAAGPPEEGPVAVPTLPSVVLVTADT